MLKLQNRNLRYNFLNYLKVLLSRLFIVEKKLNNYISAFGYI